MSLPIKRVYNDSIFKTKDSKSNSEFKFELTHSIQLPDNCVCYIDDIIIPHTWYTIEDFNNKLYVRGYDIGVFITDRTSTIANQNYTGDLLAAAIQTALDVAFTSITYTVTYMPRKGTIKIETSTANRSFVILDDNSIQDQLEGSWTGQAYDVNTPQSMNEVLRHTFGSPANTFESGFLDLKTIHNIYISNPNLGNFSTLGARGECSIINKVPVSSDYGYSNLDNVVASHDYIDVSKHLLSVIEFKLSSARRDVIPLHGSHVSFSIVSTTIKPSV